MVSPGFGLVGRFGFGSRTSSPFSPWEKPTHSTCHKALISGRGLNANRKLAICLSAGALLVRGL